GSASRCFSWCSPRAAPRDTDVARYLVGMTGASGAAFGVDFLKRCPGEKYLVLTDWARQVLQAETGLKPSDLEPLVKRLFADRDLAAPFASGSNRYDALVIVPCSVSTLAKIAVGIGDTLLTRAAQVALKERIRMVVCVRETPLSSIALENALRLARRGDLKRVAREVDWAYEVTEIAAREARAEGPALLFEKVRGAAFPLVVNLLAARRRIEWALGRTPAAVGAEIEELIHSLPRL